METCRDGTHKPRSGDKSYCDDCGVAPENGFETCHVCRGTYVTSRSTTFKTPDSHVVICDNCASFAIENDSMKMIGENDVPHGS